MALVVAASGSRSHPDTDFCRSIHGDWDALEYTLSALRGYPSLMALARSLFIFFNHELYVIRTRGVSSAATTRLPAVQVCSRSPRIAGNQLPAGS